MQGSDYGLQIGEAVRAVARLHSDTSRLLIDCDKEIGKGRKSVFGSYATRELTYSVKADAWMAEAVYRYYDAGESAVDALTAVFYMPHSSGEPSSVLQPIVIAGRIEYTPATSDASGKTQCKEWDLWTLFFKGGHDPELGTLFGGTNLLQGRIASARWTAAPLVSISSVDAMVKLMEKVTEQQSHAA